jgi:hypothetical protein
LLWVLPFHAEICCSRSRFLSSWSGFSHSMPTSVVLVAGS